MTHNVWLKLVICCLRSKYKLRAKVRRPKPRTLAVLRVKPNQNMYKQMGASVPAKGGRLALAIVLAYVFLSEQS